MSGGAFYVRRPGAASPLDGYELIGTVDGSVALTPDGDGRAEEPLVGDGAAHLPVGSMTMTMTIEDLDEDLMRRLSGWTVLMTEDEATRLRTLRRVYAWDYEMMRRDGSHECPVHPPTLVLPLGVPSAARAISAWLVIKEGPGRDFAYVREDEPDVLHVVSAIDAS